MPRNMKNAGLTIMSSDGENKSSRDSQSSKMPLIEQSPQKACPYTGKGKERQPTCNNADDSSKKDYEKKEKPKQHKIRMPQRKGGLQLWQFLYALLEDTDKQHSELIEWTHNRKELEFRLNDPEAIALWWGIIKHRANMTYERLSRSLRYYYDRGILKKMGGERYLYRFCIDPEDMYQHIGLSDSRPVLKPMPLPVNKWVSSRMIPSQHLEPFYLSPDYMSLGMPQQLPPPPPYPGYQFHSPQYQATSQMSYDFYTEQDGEQNFTFNQQQPALDNVHSFNTGALSSHNPGSVFASHTAFAVASSSHILSYSNYMQSEQERSLSASDVHSDTDSDSSPHQSASLPCLPARFTTNVRDSDIFQYSPEANTHLQYDYCNLSPLDSGSGSELEEIIPLLESMEDSDCVPLSMSPPCSFSPYPNASSTLDSLPQSSVSSPNMTSTYSPHSQMPLQTSPTICSSISRFGTPSPWMREENMWKFP